MHRILYKQTNTYPYKYVLYLPINQKRTSNWRYSDKYVTKIWFLPPVCLSNDTNLNCCEVGAPGTWQGPRPEEGRQGRGPRGRRGPGLLDERQQGSEEREQGWGWAEWRRPGLCRAQDSGVKTEQPAVPGAVVDGGGAAEVFPLPLTGPILLLAWPAAHRAERAQLSRSCILFMQTTDIKRFLNWQNHKLNR